MLQSESTPIQREVFAIPTVAISSAMWPYVSVGTKTRGVWHALQGERAQSLEAGNQVLTPVAVLAQLLGKGAIKHNG
jgi:hypothetical protein